MKKTLAIILSSAFALTVFAGCAEELSETPPETLSDTTASTEISSEGNDVAGENETAPEVVIDTEGLEPVYGESLKDGIYEIEADSSSSMFRIEKCVLTVKDGKMTALMTMSGKGYLYLFMGRGADAAESEYIPFNENENGEHTFTVPVEALDKALECSAFSKSKEKWYDRTLVFRSSSLPLEAFADGMLVTAESLSLSDGEYTADVTLNGGSGRASVSSPAKLTVENGEAFAEIVWSSSNYDYMKIDDVKYDILNSEGNSAFKIPVKAFDREIPIIADTTAMGTPHEIEYTLLFDSESITK